MACRGAFSCWCSKGKEDNTLGTFKTWGAMEIKSTCQIWRFEYNGARKTPIASTS
jgi:hypothetical protein